MIVVHSAVHTHMSSSYRSVGLDLGLVFVHSFRFSILCVFLV